MAKSFRLQFVDIDSSYTINTTEAAVKGYITVRAPKGTTEAMYFNYGNEKAINAMIGLPTANWIDLYEAVAFNQEYGLYISAPAGTGKDYPSYYGGVYLTTRGPFDYWQVGDADEPSFEVCMNPGNETVKWGTDVSNAEISIDWKIRGEKEDLPKDDEQILLKISGLHPNIFSRMNYMNLNYWGCDGCPVDEGIVTYKFDGNTTFGHLKYVDPDEGVQKEDCGLYYMDGGLYTIYIGGTNQTIKIADKEELISNNGVNTIAPFLSPKNLFNYNALRVTEAAVAEPEGLQIDDFLKFQVSPEEQYTEQKAIKEYFRKALLNGLSIETTLSSPESGKKLLEADPFLGIDTGDRLEERVNIKDITFCRVNQKSQNETPTIVEISNIGYDKWQYDQQCAWIPLSSISGTDASGPVIAGSANEKLIWDDANKDPEIKPFAVSDALKTGIMSGNTDGYVIIAKSAEDVSNKKNLSVAKLDPTTGYLKDVTADFLTQRFYINGQIMPDGKIETSETSDQYTYEVYEIFSANVKHWGHVSYKCAENDNSFPLKRNVNYNTLTISCKEEVYPGEYTTGGEFTGSLSETGVDSFGSNIYWPNILPAETVTFIEVIPVQTFDKVKGPGNVPAINDHGFFIGSKIVDPIGPAKDVYSEYLRGQRFCTHVNEEQQKLGLLGCSWCDDYFPIIKEGLIEAQNPDYDDALVFMEPSGYEEYKPLLMSLRVKYHDTSTIISPKIITKAQLLNPKTITVSGRSKGTAQYIGEFKKYDTYTGKNYYCQPIGDVGLQLARIMDKKMGGIAPAGTNDSAGLGGCLARPVLAAKWKFSDDALKILDEKGLCAITYDADNGLMIQSQKSTQDPSMVTDWSYLGHSMSFDLCKREIRDKVMVQQVFKRINQYWMDIRTKQVQAILDKRTTGVDPIWATASVDITGQNTPTTMAKRQFVIKVTCKVYVYSETVLLIFENLAQE